MEYSFRARALINMRFSSVKQLFANKTEIYRLKVRHIDGLIRDGIKGRVREISRSCPLY